jgi:hypothetical protein
MYSNFKQIHYKMKKKKQFHGIILGIYADMMGIKHERALNHLLLQKEALGDSLIPLSQNRMILIK